MSGVRVFRRDRANIKQPLAWDLSKRTDLHLLRGRGMTRPYKLGDPAVQKEVLLRQAQRDALAVHVGRVAKSPRARLRSEMGAPIVPKARLDALTRSFEARQLAAGQDEWPEASPSNVMPPRNPALLSLRRLLITQGPMTAERAHAARTELLKREQSGQGRPNDTLTQLEQLRLERYLFRMTIARWRRLCGRAGHADGTQLSADQRPFADSDHVYVPREVYLSVVYRKGASSPWRADLLSAEVDQNAVSAALPEMASFANAEAVLQDRKAYLEDLRERWRRLTGDPASSRGTPTRVDQSLAGERAVSRRRAAEARLQQSALDYLREPYAVSEAEAATA